jgi:hypothetical protein
MQRPTLLHVAGATQSAAVAQDALQLLFEHTYGAQLSVAPPGSTSVLLPAQYAVVLLNEQMPPLHVAPLMQSNADAHVDLHVLVTVSHA